MFATTIRFTVPESTDWESLRALMVRSAFESFRSIPGLRTKAFVFAPERAELGGNYVWETQDDAEAYLRSDTWRAVVSRFGEACSDLVWPPEPASLAAPREPATSPSH